MKYHLDNECLKDLAEVMSPTERELYCTFEPASLIAPTPDNDVMLHVKLLKVHVVFGSERLDRAGVERFLVTLREWFPRLKKLTLKCDGEHLSVFRETTAWMRPSYQLVVERWDDETAWE